MGNTETNVHKYIEACGPEQLQTLQRVFDLIWMELRTNSLRSYSGPFDPDALRNEIAKRVLSQYGRDGANANEITRQVLRSFGVEPCPMEQSHGLMTKHDTHHQGRD